MALITVRNTRSHEINLTHVDPKGPAEKVELFNNKERNAAGAMPKPTTTTVIPAAKPHPTQHHLKIHGTAKIDADALAAARKSNPAVDAFFTEGWLLEGDDKPKSEPEK